MMIEYLDLIGPKEIASREEMKLCKAVANVKLLGQRLPEIGTSSAPETCIRAGEEHFLDS